MLEQKKEEFEAEEPGDIFPEFFTLGSGDLIYHQDSIRTAFDCPRNLPILDVFSKMVELSTFIPKVNAKNKSFSFGELLKSEGIDSNSQIFLDWHRLDDIDSIELSKFSEFFDDIWYPEANDIYVYDDTFSWFALVTHYGAISITRIEN
jgi:hypothetical protein